MMADRIFSLDRLTDRMRRKTIKFIELANEAELDVFVWESLRTLNRQYYLFGKWRTKDTLRKYGVPEHYSNVYTKIVTWTLNSRHLWGEAIDIVFDTNSDPKIESPSWSGDYSTLIEIGKECGLRNLAPTELCHFEDDGTELLTPEEERVRDNELTICERSLSEAWKWMDNEMKPKASELASYIRTIM